MYIVDCTYMYLHVPCSGFRALYMADCIYTYIPILQSRLYIYVIMYLAGPLELCAQWIVHVHMHLAVQCI